MIFEHLKDGLLLCVVHSKACVVHGRLQLLRPPVVVLSDFDQPLILVKLGGVIQDVKQALFIQFLVVVETLRH